MLFQVCVVELYSNNCPLAGACIVVSAKSAKFAAEAAAPVELKATLLKIPALSILTFVVLVKSVAPFSAITYPKNIA